MVETMSDFRIPTFDSGCLEFRLMENEICIYATKDGLEWLATKCACLAARTLAAGGTEHLHIEDYQVLTQQSLPAVIARFEA
jgi:hypothetical protein